MVIRTSPRPVPLRPQLPRTPAARAPAGLPVTLRGYSNRSSFARRPVNNQQVPLPARRLTAGLSRDAARAQLATPLRRTPGQTLAQTARQRTAVQNDADPTRGYSSNLSGASATSTQRLEDGARGERNTVVRAAGFDSSRGTGTASTTRSRSAREVLRRERPDADPAAATERARRDAVDRATSVSVIGGPRATTPNERSQYDSGQITEATGARLRLLQRSAGASGDVRVGPGTLRADGRANAEANLVRAEAVATRRINGREYQVRGELQVGASANTNSSVVFDPRRGEVRATAGADVFVGARAGVSGTGEIFPGIRLGGTAEARAGLGIGANASAGYSRGTFRINGSVAATLGLGGKLGGSVEINPREVIAGVRASLSPATRARLDTVARTAGSAVNTVRNTIPQPVREGITAARRAAGNVAATGLRQTVAAYRSVTQVTARTAQAGQRLAQRATRSLRTVFTRVAPSRVAGALVRSFFGG